MAVTNYIWDVVNDSYLMETDEEEAATATYTNEPVEYGALISEHRNGWSNTYYFDAANNTRKLMDAGQAEKASAVYTAFGVLKVLRGDPDTRFLYGGAVGVKSDPSTHTDNIRARTYNSSIGRWLSVDPLSLLDRRTLASEGLMPYKFARNDPVAFSDPSGLVPTLHIIPLRYKCHCGFADMWWQLGVPFPADLRRRNLGTRFLAQKICYRVTTTKCELGCGCHPSRVKKDCHKCYLELLPDKTSGVRDLPMEGIFFGEEGFISDHWRAPWYFAAAPSCISVGKVTVSAVIRSTDRGRDIRRGGWLDPSDNVDFCGFKIRLGYHMTSVPADWDRPGWWKEEGESSMTHVWNCCPVRRNTQWPFGSLRISWNGVTNGRFTTSCKMKELPGDESRE